MGLFFKKLLWPSLVVVLIELIYVHSQPHWLILTLVFAVINALALLGIRFVVAQPASSGSR